MIERPGASICPLAKVVTPEQMIATLGHLDRPETVADPRASRMPNFRVRALTANANTPATPTTAIANATGVPYADLG